MTVAPLASLLILALAACSDPPAPAPPLTPTSAPAPAPSPAPAPTPAPAPSPAPAASPALAPTPALASSELLPPSAPPTTPAATTTPLLPIPSPQPGLQVLTGGRFHLTLANPTPRPQHLTLLTDLTPVAELALPRPRPGCTRPELVAGHLGSQRLTVELRCPAPPVPAARRRFAPHTANAAPADTQTTLTFDLGALSPTRIVAGAALSDTQPLAAIGFPALSPDAIHVALIEHGEQGALRLGVRRVDDGREVFDEALLTDADVRFRPREPAADRHRRLVRTASSRASRVQRILDRVGFTPMTRAPTDVTQPTETMLALPACTPRQTRAFQRAGGHPAFAGCIPGGCSGTAPVLSRWRGGEPSAGLGVEAIQLDGAPAGCGPGERWLIRAMP